MTPENKFTAPQCSKRPKRSCAGCRHADHWRKNFQPRNRERTEAHHGTEAKQPGEKSPVQVEQRNDEMQIRRCISGVTVNFH